MSTHPHGNPTAAQRQTRAFLQMAVVNGILLGAAVLLVFVFPVFGPTDSVLWILIVAAVLSGLNTLWTVRRLGAANRAEAAAGGVPLTKAVPAGPFELVVEDVATISGRGTIVSGVVASGGLQRGQRITVVRDGQVLRSAKVAAIEVARKQVASAQQGDRIGVQLAGVATRNDLQQGDRLTG